MPPPITLETMMAAASYGPRRRCSKDSGEVATRRDYSRFIRVRLRTKPADRPHDDRPQRPRSSQSPPIDRKVRRARKARTIDRKDGKTTKARRADAKTAKSA